MKNKPNFFFDNSGFPNWEDGGGPPLGNFSHLIPGFFLTAFLIAVVVVFTLNFSALTLRPLHPSPLNDDYFAFVLTVLWLFLLLLLLL